MRDEYSTTRGNRGGRQNESHRDTNRGRQMPMGSQRGANPSYNDESDREQYRGDMGRQQQYGPGYLDDAGYGANGRGGDAGEWYGNGRNGRQFGSGQRADERWSEFDRSGMQRQSEYGYGGRGTETRGAQFGSESGMAQRDGTSSSGSGDSWGSRENSSSRGTMQRGQHTGRGPKGYSRSDERIREDVSEALANDGELDASEIEVEIAGGEVTLTGTVDSRESKRRAEECAEGCSGVKDVQNRLRVESTASGSSSPSQYANGGVAAKTGSRTGQQADGLSDRDSESKSRSRGAAQGTTGM
jgi:osmotically-inducible protein OsmY